MNYHDIKKCDMLNGDGIRVSLWVAGCEHHCYQCQNPQTWGINGGVAFDKDAEEELLEALNKDYISGITFTGGDPLHENNLEDVLNLVNKIHFSFGHDKTIWMYSGFTWEEVWEKENRLRKDIISKCDVFVDGTYEDELRDVTLKWCGSSNQRIIDVQQSIKDNQIRLYTR